jgi:hypothetical protein
MSKSVTEFDHKVMSYSQLIYDSKLDRTVPIEDGLNSMSLEDWELVTSYPSNGYAPGATTMFVFRRK